MSTPLVGSSMNTTRGSRPEPLRLQALLLIAAAEQGIQPVRVRRPDVQPLDPRPGGCPFPRVVDPPCAGKFRYPAERDVLADREVSDRCLGMAVGQYQGEPQPPRNQGRHWIGGHPLAADVQADRGGNGATYGSGEYLAPGT